MGAPVAPVGKPATDAAAKQPKAEAQADGTHKVSAPAGEALPPVALQQAGWPTLPPEATATFEAVQPATIQPGTTLYAATDALSEGANSFFSATPPGTADAAGVGSQSATHVHVSTVPAGKGIKAWAGKAAGVSDELQVWVPPGAMKQAESKRFRMPGNNP